MKILEEVLRDGLWRVEIMTAGGTRVVACGTSRVDAINKALRAEPEPA